jgi:hypothetical protein
MKSLFTQAQRDLFNAGAGGVVHFDKQGRPMPFATWVECVEDLDYKRVASTHLPGGHKWVSTIWLGVNHGVRNDHPVLFESMVFGKWSTRDLAQHRYHTLEEAHQGHWELVRWWRLTRRQRRRMLFQRRRYLWKGRG